MPEAEATTVLPGLPERLASVFRAMRNGRHISRNDGPDFLDLERHTAAYEHVLGGLGYTLRHHNQGFFYLEGAGALRSERMRTALLFLLILFQDLEERKFQRQDRAWERSLLRTTFKVSDLPHFQTAQRRSLMAAIDLDEAKIPQVLGSLERLGVVRLLPENQFGFLPPVYRFIDLCIRYAENPTWAVPDGEVIVETKPTADEETELDS